MGQVGRDDSGSLLESRSLLLTALRALGDTPGGTGAAGKGRGHRETGAGQRQACPTSAALVAERNIPEGMGPALSLKWGL